MVTARGAVEGRVLVTDRLTPLRIADRLVHQIWLPYHWGANGWSTGDSANDLLAMVLDPNVLIQEGKSGTCDVRAGRRPHGPDLVEYLNEDKRRAGILEFHRTPIITTDAVDESYRCGRPEYGP